MNLNISIVIPVYNEAGSLSLIHKQITETLSKLNKTYEIIFINDGSTDDSQEILEKLYIHDKKHVRVIQFRTNFGKAAALRAGFIQSLGKYIIQLDADLQDGPDEIPKFLEQLDKGFDVVVGWKQERQDGFVKNYSSKFFNLVTNFISRAKLHDHNCGFKAYVSEVAKELNLYGELHRYIPVIASARGYTVTEVKILHRARSYGKTKYGNLRFIHGFFDLLTVLFITRFKSRPLHLFGYLGLLVFSLGFVIAGYLSILKFMTHQSIGDRPLLLLSVMLMIMGVQVLVTGLVGEQLTTLIHKNEADLEIKKVLN